MVSFLKTAAMSNLAQSLEINNTFKQGFIEQISIRDMLMYDVNDLVINLKNGIRNNIRI